MTSTRRAPRFLIFSIRNPYRFFMRSGPNCHRRLLKESAGRSMLHPLHFLRRNFRASVRTRQTFWVADVVPVVLAIAFVFAAIAFTHAMTDTTNLQ
jgi:hypothetical protein